MDILMRLAVFCLLSFSCVFNILFFSDLGHVGELHGLTSSGS
jgi:hypothetical protein